MTTISFLHRMVFSAVALAFAFSMTATQGTAQQTQEFSGAHFHPVVFDGSTHAGWYSFPGQRPKLHFSHDQVRITSREHSTVLLSRDADLLGSSAEVWLSNPPVSTSSISGLAVLSDQDHAMVIALDSGAVVLWQMDPTVTKVIARQQVNESSPLEFRVSGGEAANVRFFWRHRGDNAWHPLGDRAVNAKLSSWKTPLRFGLLLDGPQGSQVVFSNYRASGNSGMNQARNSMPATWAAGE